MKSFYEWLNESDDLDLDMDMDMDTKGMELPNKPILGSKPTMQFKPQSIKPQGTSGAPPIIAQVPASMPSGSVVLQGKYVQRGFRDTAAGFKDKSKHEELSLTYERVPIDKSLTAIASANKEIKVKVEIPVIDQKDMKSGFLGWKSGAKFGKLNGSIKVFLKDSSVTVLLKVVIPKPDEKLKNDLMDRYQTFIRSYWQTPIITQFKPDVIVHL